MHEKIYFLQLACCYSWCDGTLGGWMLHGSNDCKQRVRVVADGAWILSEWSQWHLPSVAFSVHFTSCLALCKVLWPWHWCPRALLIAWDVRWLRVETFEHWQHMMHRLGFQVVSFSNEALSEGCEVTSGAKGHSRYATYKDKSVEGTVQLRWRRTWFLWGPGGDNQCIHPHSL